jgi:hypothetical protein
MSLTKSQRFALQWIDAQPHTRARWMRNGKDAYGKPETWDAFELSGRNGSLIMSLADHAALRDLYEPASEADRSRMYKLSDKGKKALASSSPEITHE